MILVFANPFWNHIIAQSGRAIETMLIDWFTVGATAAQLPHPGSLVDEAVPLQTHPQRHRRREKRIAAELADADVKKAEAKKERDEFQHKNETFDKESAALLKTATDAAEVRRSRSCSTSAARPPMRCVPSARKRYRNEQRNLNQEIIRWTQKEVFAIARKALADLATASLEERMSEAFVQRLRALTGEAKEQLATALKASTHPVPVRSAFDLPPEQQAAIQKAINETFSADIHIQFETVPELVSGIELTASGQKVAWSIAEYLATLEKSAGELLHTQEKPEPKPEIKPASEVMPDAKSKPKGTPQHEREPGLSAPKVDH